MELVILALVFLLVVVLAAVGSLVLLWRAVQRRNRVNPKVPTAAPMFWMWSPMLAARLHRRLQAAAAVARAVTRRNTLRRGPSPLGEMARTLEREAVALDDHLSIVGRMHVSQRRHALPLVVAEVARIEQLAHRLSLAHADQQVDARLADQASALEQLTIELDQFEAANAVLSDVEADAGLRRTNPLRPMPAQGTAGASSSRTRPATFPAGGTVRQGR